MLIVAGLILGLGLLIYLTRVSWVQRAIDRAIQHTLERTGLVRVMDYELLLRIQHGYVVSEMEILADSKIANQALRQSRPWDHGVVILSVKSDGKDRPGIPNADTVLQVGDVVTVYGEEHHIRKIYKKTDLNKRHIVDNHTRAHQIILHITIIYIHTTNHCKNSFKRNDRSGIYLDKLIRWHFRNITSTPVGCKDKHDRAVEKIHNAAYC